MKFRTIAFSLAVLLVIQPVLFNVLIAKQLNINCSTAQQTDEPSRESSPPPLWLLAQATNMGQGSPEETTSGTFADGYEAGKATGKAEADKAGCLIAGFLCGLFAVGGAALIKPGIRTHAPADYSAEYKQGYDQGYIWAKQRTQTSYAAYGWLASIPISLLILLSTDTGTD